MAIPPADDLRNDASKTKPCGMKSVLLIGQSNMAGRGDFGEVPEISHPRCFIAASGSRPASPRRLPSQSRKSASG